MICMIPKVKLGVREMKFMSVVEISLAQIDDGPLKWVKDPYPIQIHANFQIIIWLLKFLLALCKI